MLGVPSQNVRQHYAVPSIPSVVIFPGVACGSATQSTQNWLEVNLGNFSNYAEYQDLITWNKHFVGVSIFSSFFTTIHHENVVVFYHETCYPARVCKAFVMPLHSTQHGTNVFVKKYSGINVQLSQTFLLLFTA